MATNEQSGEAWFLKSTFPVLFPSHPAFVLKNDEFEAFLKQDIKSKDEAILPSVAHSGNEDTVTDSFTMVSTPPSTTADVREAMNEIGVSSEAVPDNGMKVQDDEHPFIKGLLSHGKEDPPNMENKMLTENGDVAYRSTTNSLVDLFSELDDVVSGPRLMELLNAAWSHDKLATLKIIFNARSIHLGKSSRTTFYRCAGWLAANHPLTLAGNLRWLSRPVIDKKVEARGDADNKIVIIDAKDADESDPTHFDVRNGVAHGYWKDLLNVLTLAVNGKLSPLEDPRTVLNVDERKNKNTSQVTKAEAKVKRHELRDSRHQIAIKAFNDDPVYRALHLSITRLFAEQLKSDLALLHGTDKKAKRTFSLCAKWAPSSTLFHDKHTFIVSSIAELLYPQSNFSVSDRESYLRFARESYRMDVAALRAHLEIVERDITAKTFANIKYDHVPSIAMNNYAPIFAQKDTDRFSEYITAVADGKAKISGATLLPSTLIKLARSGGIGSHGTGIPEPKKGAGTNALVNAKLNEINAKVVDQQWRTLVQRIKDNGKLESSIAVCDVSGSMTGPFFPDKTTPMDSAIGLSLLVAEVTAPPFGGKFITFHSNPEVLSIDVEQSLRQKVRAIEASPWGGHTDFVAVFEKLILPVAVKQKLKQEDMVKRIFVFSDMQFDAAEYPSRWTTSYERIAKQYKKAGYEMPELVFWNLAGGRAGYGGGGSDGDPTAPKPVTTDDMGTALVSGYSQAMLKVFLDNGSFDEPDEEDTPEVETKDDADDDVTIVQSRKKQKMDPLNIVKKAIGHKAYDMLRVVD